LATVAFQPWMFPAALAALLALWMGAVALIYRIRGERPTRLTVVADDGWPLALYQRRAPRRRFAEPVLLCHGLAANHLNLDFEPPFSVAHLLSEAGFDCYTVEWRGTGRSTRAAPGKYSGEYSIDDFLRLDAPAFAREVLARTGAERLFLVGHSLGGLVSYLAAAGPLADRVAGVVTLGSPVRFKYRPLFLRGVRLGTLLAWPRTFHQRVLSLTLAPFLGRVTLPLSDIVINPRHVPPALQRKIYAQVISSIGRRVLLQFEDWLTHDAFRSRDGSIDYRGWLGELRAPVLILGGSRDQLAPPEVVRTAHELVGAKDKTLVVFGRQTGFGEEYGHGDLIFGTGAPREVFPLLRSWLEDHATPVR
jgi:pimeloyl-ACP methyl ester carboxylesterase